MELIGNENKIESKSDTHKNLIVIDNFFLQLSGFSQYPDSVVNELVTVYDKVHPNDTLLRS